MRIVVSGTHASGKSTLVSDFALRHPEFAVLPDPFELMDEAWDAPSTSMFARQLRISAERLVSGEHGEHFIAERGPIDFLAYILALAELTGRDVRDDLIERGTALTAEALRRVDLLAVVPLTESDSIYVDADEDPALRLTMNGVLLELIDDPDLVGSRLVVAEVTGSPQARLAELEALAGVVKRAD
ncbi:ATP-binding protein [Humibacter sp. RRB41]|uniref:ATP-binding protein n=1 Tax=Humibacter sp. RRB41 TaxID=2919946 RepID=UPI001FAA2A76|nr:ATP-binding protein [Humibacter sp. RRB41]